MDDLLAWLRDAGFIPDRIDSAFYTGAAGMAALSGPTTAGRAEYVRLMATRG